MALVLGLRDWREQGEDAAEEGAGGALGALQDAARDGSVCDEDLLSWWCPATPRRRDDTHHDAVDDSGMMTAPPTSAASLEEDVEPLEAAAEAAVEAAVEAAEATTLHCAVFRQDQAAVDRLLAAGADPDEPDYAGSGDTPLMQAVTQGHLGIVRSLCAAGCSVDARRVNGQSSLMLCVVARASRRSPRLLLQLLEVLLAAGADPGVREKLRGQTALHALAKLVAADPEEPHLLTALRMLVQRAQPHGVNAQDHRRRTALHLLASRGCASPQPYQILLEAKADAALQNARGDTPLVEFLEKEGLEQADDVVRLLSGPDVARRTTQYGESALHVAARRNRAAAVRIALGSGADPASTDLRGNTPLHLAAGRGYKEVVSLLLAAPGCPVNAANREGLTALHVAVESGFVDVVNTLLCAEGVEVGPSVLELAQQEYRLRAQPQLARTLASELDRRSSRASLTLSLGSPSTAPSTRPASTCSFSTTASSTLDATPQRSPSTRTLADDEEINYLGAQVTCTARVEPRYSGSGDLRLGSGCLLPCAQVSQQLAEHAKQAKQEAAEPRTPVPRSLAVDVSLREAAELMQKLCDEDLSVSPPADWSPPTQPRSGAATASLAAKQAAVVADEPVWKPREGCLQQDGGLRDVRTRAEARAASASAADSASTSSSRSGDSRRASACSSGSRPASRRVSSDCSRARPDLGTASATSTSTTSRKFNLPVNPYAKIRGCAGAEAGADEADEDSSDFLVESLLAVAKSITEPGENAAVDKFDRTGELPQDYELFERAVLFGGAGGSGRSSGTENIGAALGAALGAKVVMPKRARAAASASAATARASDTAIASR